MDNIDLLVFETWRLLDGIATGLPPDSDAARAIRRRDSWIAVSRALHRAGFDEVADLLTQRSVRAAHLRRCEAVNE